MASIHLETTLAVSPDELWGKLRDVGAVSDMLSILSGSSLAGDVRTCTLTDGGELTEKILSVDDEHRRVAYSITASPFPIEGHAASMQVLDAGEGTSTFRWVTDVKPDALVAGLAPMLSGEIAHLEATYGR